MKNNSDIRCAMYCRYSSFLQRDTSIEDQIHANEEFAKARGWQVLKEHIYIDKRTKGTKKLRKGLDDLLQEAKSDNPGFSYILVYDTSRFSRSFHRTSLETEELAYNGINVYFVSQGLDSADKNSRLMIAFRGLIDYESNVQLSKNSKRGVQGQVNRGYSSGGFPFGYFSEPIFSSPDNNDKPAGHILKVDIAKAETIKLIYTLYGEKKMSQTAIANFLTQEYKNKNIHKPPKGSFWSTSTIHGILSHPIYKGLYQWNVKSKLTHPVTGIEKLILNSESEWTKQQREDLRIVSDELWEKVALIKEANSRKSGGNYVKAKRLFSKHLLTALTNCSVCNRTFAIISGGKDAKYGCSTNHQGGPAACNNSIKLNKNLFEQAVIDVICEELVKEEQLAHILNETHKTLELLLLENLNKDTLQQITALEKEINNISSAIKTSENIKVRSETLLFELSHAEIEKRELEQRMITPGTNTVFNVQELITLDDLRVYFEVLINDLKTSEKNKESLPKAIRKVVVHPKDEATAEIELLENTEITGSYILETVSKRDSRIRFATGKVFYASTYEHAKEAVELFKKKWSMKYPSAVECLTDNIEACLTYYKYPYQHWLRIRTTNVVERSFKDVKRRVKGIGRFQNEERALTMVYWQLNELKWNGASMTREVQAILMKIRETKIQRIAA